MIRHASVAAPRVLARVLLLGFGLTSCKGGGDAAAPPPPTYAVGGSITGLTGSGLLLQNLQRDELSLSPGASTFTFPTRYESGMPYNVTVKTQPGAPSQTCTISNGNGTVTGDVQVPVACITNLYAVGGTIAGLTGSGLTLQLNAGTPLSLAAASGGFSFKDIPSGTSYSVTVGTQPTNPAQTCTIANGTGTVAGSNVSNIAVTCVTVAFTLGGAVSGLTGSGLVLQNNGGSDVAIPAGASSFTFAGTLNAGAGYAVTVKTQPTSPSQTCTIANGTGTVSANVTNVIVSCVTNAWTVGGTVTGLSGAGLSLLLNGASPLAIAPGATSFVFPATLAPGAAYTVAVAHHPAGQTCSVASGSGNIGTGNVTNVAISCTNNPVNTWTVGGSISGLTSSGLVLRMNGSVSLPVAAGETSFAFPAVPAGSSYAIAIATQPASQVCTVSNGSGTVGTANVTSVAINCAAARYTVGGTITGLVGTGLSLLLNGGARVTLPAGTTSFTFLGTYPSGTEYTATVSFQPSNPTQACTITNASGTVGSANVTNIEVACVTVYTIGGTLSEAILRSNGGTLLLNGGSPVSMVVDRPNFTFATALPSGTPYTVTVGTKPNAPPHTCTVKNGSGTVGTSNVTNISVVCLPDGPIVAGGIAGYTGTGLTLRNNAGPPLTPQSKGKFAFPDLYAVGDLFSTVIASQPTGPVQTCTLVRAMGAVPAETPTSPPAVFNIGVTCVNNVTSPLSGTYTTLINGKRQFLTLWADGTYAFASRLDDVSCPNDGNGVEYGAYNWNATTGEFRILSGQVDSNGPCGLWDGTAPQPGLTGTLTRSGNTLTLSDTDGTYTLTAVTNTPSSLVGSWGRPDGIDGGFLVILEDQTYLFVQTQAGVGGTGIRVGYERGCYTSTGTTITITLSASCKPDGAPALDNNGNAGASGGDLDMPIPYVVTGPNTVTIGGDTFLVRIVPN